jgi:hypothetical protein
MTVAVNRNNAMTGWSASNRKPVSKKSGKKRA